MTFRTENGNLYELLLGDIFRIYEPNCRVWIENWRYDKEIVKALTHHLQNRK